MRHFAVALFFSAVIAAIHFSNIPSEDLLVAYGWTGFFAMITLCNCGCDCSKKEKKDE